MTTLSTAARPRVIVARTGGAKAGATGVRAGSGADASGLDRAAPIAPRRDLALADLLDRAGAHLTVLRSTLDEAARLERSAGARADELAGRLDQCARFVGEFDQRLASAGRAAASVEQAGVALRELERVLGAVRTLNETAEQRFAERLNAACATIESRLEQELGAALARALEKASGLEARFAATVDTLEQKARLQQVDAMLEEQRTAYERALNDQRARFETRLAELEARLEETTQRVERSHHTLGEHAAKAWSGIERRISERAETLSARLDRETAAAHARAAVVLDSTSDRLGVLERQAAHLAGDITRRADDLCVRAERLLGLDPRTGEPNPDADARTLAGALRQANETLDRAERVHTALQAGAADADEHRHMLASAAAQAQTAADAHRDQFDRLEAAIDQARARMDSFGPRLSHAERLCADAERSMTEARERMSTVRDDLDTVAAAARYHVDQVQAATTRLRGAIEDAERAADGARAEGENARVRAEALQRAMDEVTGQARALVELARDVGALVQRGASPGKDEGGEAPVRVAV